MAFTLIATGTAAGNSGSTGNIDMTGADLLFAIVSAAGLIAPTDTSSNTWVPLTAQDEDFGAEIAIYYVENPTVTSAQDFTLGASGLPAMVVAGFSGAALTSVFDVENGVGPVGSPTQTGSVTPSANNALVITGVGGTVASSSSIDSGFSSPVEVFTVGGVNFSASFSYLIQTTATAVNPTWTFTGAGSSGLVIAAFNAAGGPPPPSGSWPGYISPFGFQ